MNIQFRTNLSCHHDPVPQYHVAVRTLCEFTAKSGDLDLRFTPGTSASEGVAGHRLVALRRGANYQREVALHGDFQSLTVRGRADGYDPSCNRLEEFKTYRGDLARMATNRRALHWAQLETYGALLCRRKGLANIELALVYFDVNSQEETLLRAAYSAEHLNREFIDRCTRFLAWAKLESQHRESRDVFLSTLPFPHAAFHPSQRRLAESVYKTAYRSGTLLAQAPTGIGKTLGTLFPTLRAVAKKNMDKVFFLVAKTSGRAAVLAALRLLLGDSRADVRVLEYSSRKSACEYPGRTCDAQGCPLAKGFYDRLPQGRLAAISMPVWDRAAVRDVALSAHICPYYLTQELARWSDVIIADYNHYFDSSAWLFALTNENQWRVAILVDEAHNLLPRARQMYSATLGSRDFAAAVRAAPLPIRRLLRRVGREWARIAPGAGAAHSVLPQPPGALLAAITRASTVILDYFADDATALDGKLQEFLFLMLKFSRLAESFGAHSLLDVIKQGPLPELTIRNIVPALFLAPRFSASTATVLFSATLAPASYYRKLLGLPTSTSSIDVETPFRSDQLRVKIAQHISTRYADRPSSVSPIVDLIASQYRARPGNYLAYFSSYAYLSQIFTAFRALHPSIPAWEQSQRMDASACEVFLSRFSLGSCGIGFAVLGGIFGEGIDLPGDRLIGAFIATLGLPQVNAINAQFARRMQEQFGAGYAYTYLYPGLQKVIQAAGRVIRTTTDSGCVHLIDDRFAQPAIRELLPAWWQLSTGRR
jgi:DNA excision repair protein ERCC-2